jgi:radical SAM superfamily enzyme YgiQ (UPF0313 family)
MRIVLVQPPRPKHGVDAEKHWQLTRPLSLFLLAGAIEDHTTHQVEILDLEQKQYADEPIELAISQVEPADVFGITATTFTRFEAIEVARSVKKIHPNALVVAGGVHFMHAAEDTLEHVPEIDVIVHGEGEVTLLDLLEAYAQGRDLGSVKGISHRVDGRPARTAPQNRRVDLDAIQAYMRFSWKDYREYLFGYLPQTPAVSMMASRGCPHRCAFCSKAGTKYRTRTASKVVDEMEALMAHCGVQAFNFVDLSFAVKPDYVRSLCDEIVQRGLEVKWWCECRANTPLDLLKDMKKAGCVSVVVGIESGSPRIVSKISKGISIQQAVAFCQRCVRLGIRVVPYFMYSCPDETRADADQTITLIKELETYTENCSFQPCMVLPGTEIERIARTRGIIPSDFSWCAPYSGELNDELGQHPSAPLFLDGLTPQDLRELKADLDADRARRREARTAERRRRHRVTSIACWAADLSWRQLAAKGIRRVLTGNFDVPDVLSCEFVGDFFRARFGRRSRADADDLVSDRAGG